MPARSTSIVVPDDASLASKSVLIAAVRVLSTTPVERDGSLWTETTAAVDEALRGTSPGVITILEPGGELDGRVRVVFGAPRFVPGERALLFLAADARGAYRTADLAAGKFAERADRTGRRFWVRDLRGSGLRILETGAEGLEGFQREASGFESSIRSGRLDARSYLLPFAESGEGEVEAQFATTGGPVIHRWFSFEDGTPAWWRAMGRQNGYARGGVDELSAALALWSECAGTKIDYRFAGESGAAPNGSPAGSGANEVFFEDPRDDIQGSWNGRDGVVAVGGFEAVAAGRAWSSQFEADAAHPAASFDAWVIVGGKVVLQDGVTPARGISSAILAEILAHELGHTLGLGHSAEPRALMYARMQNFGPYLRDDDRLAARWLYPGSSSPASDAGALAAPEGLVVSSASSDLVRLAWSDVAADEAFQTIYLKPAGGMFAKLRDVGPNVTVANVTGLTPGETYLFEVTARTAAAESAPSNTVEVTVPRPAVESAFVVAPPAGTAGITTFSFYDQSKGLLAVRAWDFGDGDSSTAANPTHVFRKAGSFQVRLTVRDDRGEESVFTRTVSVAAAPALAPDFSWAPAEPRAGESLRFIDRSSGAPTRWTWSFGDGTVSTERDPIKTFDLPGRYAVSLEVRSGLGIARVVRDVDVVPAEDPIEQLTGK